jgi:outer membrane beta-barrel protein
LGGVIPNDDFFAYLGGGFAYGYYFSENLGIDISVAYTHDKKTSLENSLTSPRPSGPGLLVRLPEVMGGYASVSAVWNLLHGKLGFFDTRLTEFDIGLTVGVGAVQTWVTEPGEDTPLGKIGPCGSVGIASQFYLSDNFALRVAYKQFFFPKDSGKKRNSDGSGESAGVSFPLAAIVGLSYFTDAPD